MEAIVRLEDLIAKLVAIDHQRPGLDVIARDLLTTYSFELSSVCYDSDLVMVVIGIDDQDEE